jgi:hypothetical protein
MLIDRSVSVRQSTSTEEIDESDILDVIDKKFIGAKGDRKFDDLTLSEYIQLAKKKRCLRRGSPRLRPANLPVEIEDYSLPHSQKIYTSQQMCISYGRNFIPGETRRVLCNSISGALNQLNGGYSPPASVIQAIGRGKTRRCDAGRINYSKAIKAVIRSVYVLIER